MGRHLPLDTSLLVLVVDWAEVSRRDGVLSSMSSVMVLDGNPTTAGTQRHASTNTFLWRK